MASELRLTQMSREPRTKILPVFISVRPLRSSILSHTRTIGRAAEADIVEDGSSREKISDGMAATVGDPRSRARAWREFLF